MSETARRLFLLWAGIVIGVSFIATPVKFLAPDLQLTAALQVGRVTFRALAATEALLLTAVLAACIRHTATVWRSIRWPCGLAGLLAIQYGVLLPIIGKRTDQVLDGVMTNDPSSLHWIYVLVELIKVVSLVYLGVKRVHAAALTAASSFVIRVPGCRHAAGGSADPRT